MKNFSVKICSLLFVALLSHLASAGPGFELGLRAGITSSRGTITLKDPSTNAEEVYEPDGRGTGFTGGAYYRLKLLLGFFVQAETNYASYRLKNFYEFTVFTATFRQETDLTYGGLHIPIYFGKSFAKDIFRIYLGPSLTYAFNSNIKVKTGNTTNEYDLLDKNDNISKEIDFIPVQLGLEFGIGSTIPVVGIGADIRYSAPLITGIYGGENFKGMPGILSITLQYKLFKLGI